MPKANLYNLTGQTTSQVDLPESWFAVKPSSHHLWRSVTTHLSNQRLGTVKTKGKGEVSGGGKKPFRQKGTGNARQGSIRAVQFVGGGIAHGPKPRDFSLLLPKKMKQQALAESFSIKANEGNVFVIQSIQFDKPRTKQAVELLKNLKLSGRKCLILIEKNEPAVVKSFRNVPKIKVLSQENVNTYEVLNHEVVLLTESVLKIFSQSKKDQVKEAGVK